jgi:hypothetical protein
MSKELAEIIIIWRLFVAFRKIALTLQPENTTK